MSYTHKILTSQEKSNTLWNNDKAYIRNIPRLRHEAHAFCLTIFLKPGMKKISKMQIDRYFDSQTILPFIRLFSPRRTNYHWKLQICILFCIFVCKLVVKAGLHLKRTLSASLIDTEGKLYLNDKMFKQTARVKLQK